jgi:hypothetical protein
VTGLHSQLLLAAFAEPQRAVPAWTQWQAQSRWEETVDFDAYVLLPRIYQNLGKQGLDDALFLRLKGVVKHNWAANTAVLNGIAALGKQLQRNAITAILLPPCALLLGDRSMAMGPGEPIAYRIARRDAQRVARLLYAQGWRSAADAVPRWCLPGYIAATQSLRMRCDELSLHLQWIEPDMDCISTTRQVFHGQSICSLGMLDSVHLLLCAPEMGTELVRITRALLLLQRSGDQSAWRCLLQLLYASGSSLADLVESLMPPAIAVRSVEPHAVQRVRQHERQDATPQDDEQHKLVSTNTRATTVWQHYQLRWQHYRAALGKEFSSVAALRCLPGYLMGRWQLQHLSEIVRTAYRALRFQWRAHRSPGQGQSR